MALVHNALVVVKVNASADAAAEASKLPSRRAMIAIARHFSMLAWSAFMDSCFIDRTRSKRY